MVAFVFFRIVVSVISLGQKQKIKKAGFHFVGSTSCPIIKPKHVKLSGPCPIYLSGSDLAGPARIKERNKLLRAPIQRG